MSNTKKGSLQQLCEFYMEKNPAFIWTQYHCIGTRGNTNFSVDFSRAFFAVFPTPLVLILIAGRCDGKRAIRHGQIRFL
jgi:hypothetical protein